MAQDPRAPRYSPDGQWWWDGMTWRPVAPPPAPPPSGGMPFGGIIAVVAVVVVIVLVTVSVLAFLAFKRLNDSLAANPIVITAPIVAGGTIPCDQLEHTQVHYHAELQILNAGHAVPIPTGVGRTASCFYWLHMHNGEPGMIHIESPSDRTFTLADFFSVWSAWSGEKQLLDRTHVSTIALTGDEKLAVYVDKGDGTTVYTGEPAQIVLEGHEVITLEITPPTIAPPPGYTWPPGF
jgi:hypothetical protein